MNALRRVALALSLLLWAGAVFAYGRHADACAAVTVWPVWAWVGIGLALAVVGRGLPRKWPCWVAGGLWLVFVLVFAEEPRSLLRSFFPTSGDAPLRVISLNCNGNRDAAAEVAAYRPDIVLFQESPARVEVEKLGRALFGDQAVIVTGTDVSVLARGKQRTQSRWSNWTRLRLELADGVSLELFNVRLPPNLVLRGDLWRPSCWREFADDHRKRRQWLRELVAQLESVPPDVPLLVAGDFNATAREAVFDCMKPRLRDAFVEAGRGWGNTLLNSLPLWRIDMVWGNDCFRPISCRAQRTAHSDHRMVICDLQIQPRDLPSAHP